jgi:hypothetical protein
MAKKGIPTEGVELLTAYPRLSDLIEQQRQKELSDDLVLQLERVHVPSQILNGTPADFQFTAFPLPEPDYETRKTLPIFPERTITICGENWEISIDINVFGLVSWFYVKGIPELYRALEPHLPMGE